MAIAMMSQLVTKKTIHLVKRPDWLPVGRTPTLSHFMDDGTLMEVPLCSKLPRHVEVVVWVRQWSHIVAPPSGPLQVPPAACAIMTPLILLAFADKLPTSEVGALLPERTKRRLPNWLQQTPLQPEISKA